MARATMRRLAALSALLVLGGCGAGGDGGGTASGGLQAGLASIIPSFGREQPDPSSPPPGFRPEDLAGGDQSDYRLMWLPTFVPQGLAKVIQDNGASDYTLQSQYGFTAAFDDGLLVGTRGLQEDLMGAYVADVARALRSGGGTAVRIHDTLGGQDEIVQARYECTIVAQGSEEVSLGIRSVTGRKFSERCGNAQVEFENLYWLDNRGVIIASRQFVTQTVAYLRSNRL